MRAPGRVHSVVPFDRSARTVLGSGRLAEQNPPQSEPGQGSGAMEQDGLSAELPALLPRLWRFALRLAGDRHDAEDLVQRACVRALERRSQLQPGTSTLSWLFSIVHSVWLNEVRARQIRSHGSMQWSEELADTVPDTGASNPEEYTLHQQVISAVEKLPDAQRTVMLLVAVEGLSYREAATVLDVPIGTVMSRIHRGRRALQKELWEYAERNNLRPRVETASGG